ncbi:MAG: DNA topoisomerase I, partial [Armatimonadetes bacterium]|nr:DNA topoisomerase I [Armatimonadota bacterium]
MSILVIVESPAKAKTISRILGPDYDVQASFGHVRDLPQSADQIPAELKKEKWTKLGVNVEKDFEPLYIVPADKKRHVDNLKKSAKGAEQLLLATDEDREGESISWHILELLKPPKKTPVKRIVFHEITPEAILEAIRQPRDLDENLVKAQETRRILDRLFGYTLSPLLWKKVAPKLSAGRVQSPAVRLCVERERQRMRFVTAEYWGLSALLGSGKSQFKAELARCDDQKLAKGVS